jgi:hypothetical protein
MTLLDRGSKRRSLLASIFRRADASMWCGAAIMGAAFFGHVGLSPADIGSMLFHGCVGLLTSMAVTGGFRAARLVRDVRDRRAIARQQDEIRREGNAAGTETPDPAGPATYRWSLDSSDASVRNDQFS